MYSIQNFSVVQYSLLLATALSAWSSQAQNSSIANPQSQVEMSCCALSADIWEGDIGGGFRSSAQNFGISLGPLFGVPILGGSGIHDMAILSLSYGHMLGGVQAKDKWYSGNWEARLELFGGSEFSPDRDWVFGLTPHLRYNFANGTRWVPFADIGAGLSATSIGPPDLGGTFEFNLQGGMGVQRFFKDDVALTLMVNYLHLSSAGIHEHNLGVNGFGVLVGVSFFF